ncbi:hypothetical protein EI555_016334, partial [Monodon monoceros]
LAVQEEGPVGIQLGWGRAIVALWLRLPVSLPLHVDVARVEVDDHAGYADADRALGQLFLCWGQYPVLVLDGQGADHTWAPSLRPVLSPMRLSTVVLLAGWATLQVKVLPDEVLAGTVTVLLREYSPEDPRTDGKGRAGSLGDSHTREKAGLCGVPVVAGSLRLLLQGSSQDPLHLEDGGGMSLSGKMGTLGADPGLVWPRSRMEPWDEERGEARHHLPRLMDIDLLSVLEPGSASCATWQVAVDEVGGEVGDGAADLVGPRDGVLVRLHQGAVPQPLHGDVRGEEVLDQAACGSPEPLEMERRISLGRSTTRQVILGDLLMYRSRGWLGVGVGEGHTCAPAGVVVVGGAIIGDPAGVGELGHPLALRDVELAVGGGQFALHPFGAGVWEHVCGLTPVHQPGDLDFAWGVAGDEAQELDGGMGVATGVAGGVKELHATALVVVVLDAVWATLQVNFCLDHSPETVTWLLVV